MVVLDEIFDAVAKGFIEVALLIDLIDEKPYEVDLVLTGPDAPEQVVRKADLVTRMVALKLPRFAAVPEVLF